MRSLIAVMCGALLGVSACVGERPTFGQATSSGTSEPDADSASDASPGGSADTLVDDNTESDAGQSRESDAGSGSSNAQTSSTDQTDTDGTGSAPELVDGCVPASGESVCGNADCPKDSECRTYAASDESSDDCGATGECESTCVANDVAAETPCGADGVGSCDGKGECVLPDKARLGQSCESAAECGSGHCAVSEEGGTVCCDTACDGVCSVCSTSGRCDVMPADDAACPAIECPDSSSCMTYPAEPNSNRCAALGQCVSETIRCVPDFESEGETCGDSMVCDGQGSCQTDCPKETGPDRSCTSECPCAVGAGLCTSDDQCEDGLICTADAAAKLGFPGSSCLPAHCVDDVQDAEETSVDCGGECGCRATYEVVEISGVPADASGASPSAMSGDGSAFAANMGRGRTSYPARIEADGVVTELEGFGAGGSTYDISADGSVIIGYLGCEDPPSCTSSNGRPYRWTGSADPEAVYNSSTGRALVSATGAVAVGEYYDSTLERTAVFRATGGQTRLITALDSVRAISADGLFIAGRLATADEGALWSHQQTALLPLKPPAAWSRWEIAVMNADGSVFAGFAYNATLETYHGYIWRNGEFSELPQLPDADYTMPYAMNANGTVVTGISGTNAYQRAFIWDEEQGTRRVLDEVRTRGLELPVDLELTNAEFLSDNGRIIVGRISGASTPSFWRVTLLD